VTTLRLRDRGGTALYFGRDRRGDIGRVESRNGGYIMANPNCERCHGDGTLYEGGAFVYCECHIEENARRLGAKGGLIGRQLESSFDRFVVGRDPGPRGKLLDLGREIIAKVITGEQFRRKSIVFVAGPNGVGKSYFAEAVIMELARRIPVGLDSFRGIMMTEADLNAELRRRIDSKKSSPDDLIDSLIKAGLVAIDDAGIMLYGDWFQEQFYRLFTARYLAMRPTVITSNYSVKEWLAACYPNHSQRIYDRFAEAGIEVDLGGKSWRREPPKEDVK